MHRERSRELADLSPGLLGDLGERPELRTGHPGAALDVLVVPPDGFHDYPELLEHFQHAPPLVPALRPCELIHICANIIWSIIVPSITTGRRSMKTSLAALLLTGLVAGCATQSTRSASPSPSSPRRAMGMSSSTRAAPSSGVAG